MSIRITSWGVRETNRECKFFASHHTLANLGRCHVDTAATVFYFRNYFEIKNKIMRGYKTHMIRIYSAHTINIMNRVIYS